MFPIIEENVRNQTIRQTSYNNSSIEEVVSLWKISACVNICCAKTGPAYRANIIGEHRAPLDCTHRLLSHPPECQGLPLDRVARALCVTHSLSRCEDHLPAVEIVFRHFYLTGVFTCPGTFRECRHVRRRHRKHHWSYATLRGLPTFKVEACK